MNNNSFSSDTPTQPTNSATPEVPLAPAPTPTDLPMSPEFPESPKSHNQKRIIIWTVGIVVVALACVLGVVFLPKLFEKPGEPTEETISSDQQNYEFIENIDLGFLKLENNSENIIYSPLSIRNGLALLQSGASGNTKDEIDNILTDASIPKYQNIADKLSLANAVFIRNTFEDKILPSYMENAQNNLDSEVLYDTFESSANMDNWVQQKTFNLIDSIGVQPTPDLRMVLANALAIQMDWKYQFEDDDTHGKSFFQEDGTVIKATTMHKTTNSNDIKYYIDNDVTALSMPLDSTSEDANLDFIAIMPSDNLNEYIDNIKTSNIETIINDLKPANGAKDGVAISIPKFKFDYALSFKEDLETLGVKNAFTTNADFTKMASEPLYVGAATHKANIDFSEEGIKAAAVTAFSMIANAMVDDEEPQPIIIDINHPFLFLIYDTNNNATWFTGAVYQPNLWADDIETYQPSY